MKCILALSELETLFFSDPTHHYTWQKRKVLDPSSKSLAQRQEVVHVVSSLIFVTLSMFPHSLQVLWLFCSWSISWYKSLQNSASCFLSLVSSFWHFLLQDLSDAQSSAGCIWTAHGCLAGPLTPSTNPKFLGRHLDKHQAFQIHLSPDCSVIFPETPCVYMLDAEDQV